MPYINTWEETGVIKKYRGLITGSELLQSVIDIEKDARFNDIRYVLNDFLELDELILTEREVAEIAAIDKAAAITNPGIHIAIVVNGDEHRAWASMYQDMAKDSPYVIKIFDNLEDAHAWLVKSNIRS